MPRWLSGAASTPRSDPSAAEALFAPPTGRGKSAGLPAALLGVVAVGGGPAAARGHEAAAARLGVAAAGLGAPQPVEVARRGAPREPPAQQPLGRVVLAQLEVADHEGLLEDLPLRVTAAHTVHLLLDRC